MSKQKSKDDCWVILVTYETTGTVRVPKSEYPTVESAVNHIQQGANSDITLPSGLQCVVQRIDGDWYVENMS